MIFLSQLKTKDQPTNQSTPLTNRHIRRTRRTANQPVRLIS